MTAKELLIQNKPLSEHWRAVVHNVETAQVMVLIWAEWMHSGNHTQEEIKGAKGFESVLLTICDEEPKLEELPEIGLRHNIDDPRSERELEQKETKQ